MNRSPDAVRSEILADLRPVRPLPRPWKRGLVVAGAATVLAAVITARFGVRANASALGPGVLWGLSLMQGGYGLLLAGVALREAIPGRRLSSGLAPGLLAAGVAVALLVTLVTWTVHPSQVPSGQALRYWRICFEMPTLFGLVPLALTLFLAFRAYPTRPGLVGGLSGLGAGMVVDGSWRTFCEVSAPSHVLSAHFASVVLLTLLGVAIATGWDRLRS